jgi:hypothetical protein
MLGKIDNLAMCADFTFALANTSKALAASKHIIETSDGGDHSIYYAYI